MVVTDEENNLVQHGMWEGNGGVALNICEVKVRDLQPEQFIEYFKNASQILPEYNKHTFFIIFSSRPTVSKKERWDRMVANIFFALSSIPSNTRFFESDLEMIGY